ncbi:MAG: hypothetical protein MZV63_23295 [Marinilabiliales bacterium]|nr:hypothetical protein [Marinilabiliales bacterium]
MAFFNGYGTELNLFRPGGRGEGYLADLEYLAATTYILRRNSDAFLDTGWTPLDQERGRQSLCQQVERRCQNHLYGSEHGSPGVRMVPSSALATTTAGTSSRSGGMKR